MRKKVLRFLGFVLVCLLGVILHLVIVGEIVEAAGLVDDTVNADNLYSRYPLMNYQLDFYVDNSWGWLPWSWDDGIGKTVMYGLYCITNFIWIINLYVSNAAGYVVAQAYELNFIDELSDKIGRNIQVIAGINETGIQSKGYYAGFLLLLILVIGIYVLYVGMIKRETSKAVQAVVNFLLIFVLSVAFIASAPTWIKKINEFSSDIAVATLDIGTQIIIADEDESQNSVDLIRDCLFSIQIRQPWVLLQFGDSDENRVGKERVEDLVSVSPQKKDRENIVKSEIEDHDNNNLTISGVIVRLGMVAFISLFNLLISLFVFILCGMMIFSQLLFIAYAMMLVINFILSMIPSYNGNIKKAIENLFNSILRRSGITLFVTITFSISTMFYSMTADYPFFMVEFLQLVTFLGMFFYTNRLLDMFGLNSMDRGSMSSKFIPMFFSNGMRGMGRRFGRVGMGSKLNERKPLFNRASRRNGRQNVSGNVNDNRTTIHQEPSRNDIKYRNQTSSTTNMQNRYLNEKQNGMNVKAREHMLDHRMDEKNVGKNLGNKIGSVLDAKDKVVDNVNHMRERVKDAPVHAAHKVHEQRAKVRENVAGFQRGVEEERLKRQVVRDGQQEAYHRETSMKRRELNREREHRQNNVQNYPGLDSKTFTRTKETSGRRTDRGHRK